MRKGYINCELYGHPGSSAMLIEDGRIVQIGTDEEIKDNLEETDEVVDIGGLFVVPGFVDSHMHLLELGYYLNNVQLLGVHTIEEVRRRVLEKCVEGSTKWIVGRGYDETTITGGDINRAFLDSLSATQPIVLRRVCGQPYAFTGTWLLSQQCAASWCAYNRRSEKKNCRKMCGRQHKVDCGKRI